MRRQHIEPQKTLARGRTKNGYFGVAAAGFTLIELLVSVALFSVVMMISVGTLLAIVDANRQAQSLRTVTDNLNFALDSMTRSIRTGYSYYCGGTPGSSPGATKGNTNDCASGGTRLVITSDDNERVEYYFDASGGGSIMRSIDGDAAQALTAPEARITNLKFFVAGSSDADQMQPTATMVLQGSAGDDPATNSTFNIQTTATQRLFDLPS